jgi:DNA-binding transcriptional LysR family regulator
MTNAEIEAFLAICAEKKFTAAAEKMFISQSSLSTRLKTLEQELGCTLFIRQRGGNSISLTSYGETLYPLALQYRELTERMRDIARTAPRRLRVATISSLGTYLFPDIYHSYLTAFPEVELEIYSNDFTESICSSLERRILDLAFTTGEPTSRKIRCVPILSEAITFICARDSDYPQTVALKILDAKNEVYVSWCAEFDEWRRQSLPGSANPGVRLSIMEQLRFFVEKPGRWAFVPDSVAKGLTHRSKKIVTRNLQFSIPPRIINCLLLPQTAEEPCAAGFLQFLRQHLAEWYDAGRILL